MKKKLFILIFTLAYLFLSPIVVFSVLVRSVEYPDLSLIGVAFFITLIVWGVYFVIGNIYLLWKKTFKEYFLYLYTPFFIIVIITFFNDLFN